MLDDAFALDQIRPDQDHSQAQQGVPPDKVKPQVWKLTEQSFMNPSPLPQLNTFTLQETLFVEQLTAIDERVRYQVSLSFLLNASLASLDQLYYLFSDYLYMFNLDRFLWKCLMVARFLTAQFPATTSPR